MIKNHSDFNTQKSIAVLPFVNMSPDADNEYFSDGITEEIINALTRVDGLKVIARTSAFAFKGKNEDVRHIGKQLGVSSVLEGSVRKSGQRVRITAQLINTTDGSHYWSRNFDRQLDDIFTLQDEVSLLIADQIRENFGHLEIQDHLVEKPTSNIRAYELYLKGHFHQLKWDDVSIKKAIECYQESVQLDPGFARSHYGLVQAYGLLAAWGYMDPEEGFSKAIESFMIASQLDKSLPEYGQSFVGRSFWMEWDFQATYNQLIETLKQHPNYTDGLEAMAELMLSHGHWQKAEAYILQAMEVDPLSANHFYTLAHINYYQKKYDSALELVNRALYINPEFNLAKELKTLCLIRIGNAAEFESYIADQDNKQIKKLLFDVIHKVVAEIPEEILAKQSLLTTDRNQLVPYELFVLANSKHTAQAFEILKQYVQLRRGQLINFRVDPMLDPLRKIEGFDQLHLTNLAIEPDEAVSEQTKQMPAERDPEQKIKMNRILQFIDNEKPYLDPQLSLSALAASLQMHPNKLSYLINEESGVNFSEFINRFRMEHFKKIATNPDYGHLTILGLAYESGFNSKTVFNTFFKKAEGTTPAGWIKSARSQ
jgi:TolB-like protein/AraC-like DNA-binding protein